MDAITEASLVARLTSVRIDLDLLEDHLTNVLIELRDKLISDESNSGVSEVLAIITKLLEELEKDE